MKKFFIPAAIVFFTHVAVAQKQNLIQFSGLVLTSDSLMGIPYATVIITGQGRGTVTNYQGFFSLVAMAGDTVKFSSIGFRPETIIIPDTLSKPKYSVIQLLTADTFFLPETVIYPWPTRDEFANAFKNLNIPDDDLERAKKNLEREKMKEIGEILSADANEATDFYYRREAQKFYYSGQIPPQNFFNPFAWAQFIEAWKRGDFRRKKK